MSKTGHDDDESTRAVVLEHNNLQEPSEDIRSVRSMPLQRDDDYFYYRGDAGCKQDCHDIDDDNDDDLQHQHVDHIGLLIGPTIIQKSLSDSEHQHEMRSSLFSSTSDVTTPWSNNGDSQQQHSQEDEFHYTAREYVELKLEIANLKAQLDDQKLHYNAMISSLQERNLALECENIDLRQQLKGQSDGHDVLPERNEALRQVKCPLQVSPDKLIEPLKEDGDKMTRTNKRAVLPRRRHSNDDKDNITHNDEEESCYVPFPQQSRKARPHHRRSPSSSANLGRRPSLSLLESLRLNSFRLRNSTSNDTHSVPNMASSSRSQIISSDDSSYSDTLHYLDEINAQTGIFNQKSFSKLLDLEQQDVKREEEAAMKNNEAEMMNHTLDVSSLTISQVEPTPSPPPTTTTTRQQGRREEEGRRRPPRRKTFTFGDDGERPPSLRHLFSKNTSQERERQFNVENELWDCNRGDEQ